MGKSMFKKLLERRIGQALSDAELKEIEKMVADDIAFNFKSFGKKPSYNEVIAITERCAIAFKRCLQQEDKNTIYGFYKL
ncbi:hypothetical protein [Clostridium coskatii]|uniref:Uncharacterized protein n=2 Tax=Clostridium coskatii TaxID=1705578 RepID=A0A166TUB9_9CLOT|nr:hypothetical protein [Clostridium coskatii]OAA94107.1 hypothetical protein WX73_03677 [Clostridium coskatii]OBR96669.1 hypothetical protein CLCOS_08310 [Clostridium coskatii]